MSYFEEVNKERDSIRTKVIKAMVLDSQTRYAGTAKPQKTCRFNIPSKCSAILNAKFGEELYVYKPKKSNTSIIISRKEQEDDSVDLISTIKFGSGKKQKNYRLRINQKLAKMFGACDIGVSIFNYQNGLALKISPKISEPDINILNAKNIEEFGKYILWNGRTIKLISFSNKTTKIPINEFYFKLVGGAFYIAKHNVSGKILPCSGKFCKHCRTNNKQVYKALYFPAMINIESESRPAVLKFTNDGISLADDILKEYNDHHKRNGGGYWKGVVSYKKKAVWKLEKDTNDINIVKTEIKKTFLPAEIGWLYSLRQDFKKIIANKENISTLSIQNSKITI